ncbi:protein gpr107 [Quercus suber]|uniref:Protein gpr107 n=1 Tax=Quercus suber TaxID=58331 RepID=A0AAW0LD87_QUESU
MDARAPATRRRRSHVRLLSDLVKPVFTFSNLKKNGDSFSTVFIETDADQYTLVFANCFANQLKVSMDVRSAMYNLDGRVNGEIISPPEKRFYLGFTSCYPWAISSSPDFGSPSSEDKSYIKRTGSAHGWDVLFYIFSFLKGITLFTLIVLIGTGWSFLKPYLQDKEKKVLMIVIPLQVVANIAQVAIDESGPFAQDWVTWKQIFLLVDVVCCCAVLFPIVWSIKNLREAARTDGKAATITSYRYLWTSVVAGELATLAFYVFTGLKFKPEAHNPYFVIDDEEEEAAAEQLKLEDEFEL